MVIIRIVCSGRKSKSVTQENRRQDAGQLVGLKVSRPTHCGIWGTEPPEKKRSYTLHMGVRARWRPQARRARWEHGVHIMQASTPTFVLRDRFPSLLTTDTSEFMRH